jgi:phosphonate transport system substrate-binding protein
VSERNRRWMGVLRTWLLSFAGLAAMSPAWANLVFGVISADSAGDAKSAWDPFISDISKSAGVDITGFYAPNYAGVAKAVDDGRVHIVFLSGRSAIEAIDAGAMEAFAQVMRTDGSRGYYATLLVRKDSGIDSLADIAGRPRALTLARGEPASVSGFLFAEQAFLLAKIGAPTFHFKKILTNSHIANALSVANREADIATNNSADFVRFAQRFPQEAESLKVIWQSQLIPHAQLLWRRDLPNATKDKLRNAILSYGQAKGEVGKRQDNNLKRMHNLAGFTASSNASLLPILDAALAIERERVMQDQSLKSPAQREQITRLEGEFSRVRAKLVGGAIAP